MRVLALETSCDETAAAVVELRDGTAALLSNQVYSQLAEHKRYGGVIPEIAARVHLEKLDGLVAAALAESKTPLAELDAVAATSGPGLLGGLLVGVSYAKSLALAAGKPFLGINHLEGHALTAGLTNGTPFPYLLLLVSGGHCQFLHVKGLGAYTTLGGTLDDAVGEAFDKTAKLLGLPYPGGPQLEALARSGNPKAYALPLPLKDHGVDFSFSGLKTAVRTLIDREGPLSDAQRADVAASFQDTVAQILCLKTERALGLVEVPTFVLAGGVAANALLRARLEAVCARKGVTFQAPPVKLCTDNAAMIAYAAALRLNAGARGDLAANALPRWPLDTLTPENKNEIK
jgi:N6-L-threonylcarbamoyladenine synthase